MGLTRDEKFRASPTYAELTMRKYQEMRTLQERKTHCDRCGHSNGNHADDSQARCLVCNDCESLVLHSTHWRCLRCNQDTSEYDREFARWCGACRDEAEAKGVFFDLDDDPYRVDPHIGPWKVSYCCWASAKGTDSGVVCRSCYADADHFDAPANLNEDRFGRQHNGRA